MFPLFKDYAWKKGAPVGIQKAEILEGPLYRIVSDPYHKWISIEKYAGRDFQEVIYDSRMLDFRKLKPHDVAVWRRESINENESWIFNEDDRVVLREKCVPDGVEIYSVYQTLVCRCKIEPKKVVFFDRNDKEVSL